MRKIFSFFFLVVTATLAMSPTRSVAQSSDTLVVAALPPGNLNEVINGDTTATGQRLDLNRVYVLQQTSPADTVYYLTGTIYTHYNLTIIGKTNPITGKPPVIAPFVNSDNSSPGAFFNASGGIITLKNLYFLGRRTDGLTQTGNLVITNGDSTTVFLDHCVEEDFSGNGLPNPINFYGVGNKLFVTNCEFRNLQNDQPFNPASVWAAFTNPMDTVVFINNTFFCVDGSALGGPGRIGYLRFDHNTMFLGAGAGAFSVRQMINAVIENNIFYGLYSAGMDSTQIKLNNVNYYGPPAIIPLDTLSTLKNPPYSLTEADRHIVIQNNAYCWPKAVYDNWQVLNDTASANGPGKIVPPTLVASRTPQMFTDHTKWPGIVVANNDSVDPGFSASVVTPAVDSLLVFIDTYWRNNSAMGYRWFQTISDPANMYANVPQNWATTQGYPVSENLAYSNDSLRSASTDGFALGDLNWFPAQLKLWEEGKVNAVKSTGPQVPVKFDLSQNYPNPFNPSTNISFTLAQNGQTSVKIYNVLGQLVLTVYQGMAQAHQKYTYNVSMDRFATGVYFYTLQQGSNIMTKKMILLK